MNLEDLKNRQNQFENKICELQTLNVVEISELSDLKNKVSQFFQNGIEIIEKQNVLRIGIVGQMKVGKSSFLNSLFFDGEEILPKAATPMTAGLTVLEYTESDPYLNIEYFTAEEWKIFETYNEEYKEIKKNIIEANPNAPDIIIKKLIDEQATEIQKAAYEIVGKCDNKALRKIGHDVEIVNFTDIKNLQNTLNQYVGTGGMFTSVVKSITIHLKDDRLRGLQIIDTPGVNDPVSSREMRTREFLQTCHGVFFLSYSAQFFDATDSSFLEERIGNQGIGTILMLASKFDVLILNLIGKFHDDLDGAFNCAYTTLSQVFNTNKAGLNCNTLNIKFDYTSGIGFSIVKKNRDKWDSIEKHVVERMQNAFPSHFSDEEDLKENFLALSNFENIKNDYLETLFKNRKNEIVAQKISGYFENNTQNLIFEIDRLQKIMNDKIKTLRNIKDKDLENIKNSDTIFISLKDALHTIFTEYRANLQTRVKHSVDKELIDYLPGYSREEIPTLSKIYTVLHKGAVYGTKYSNFEGKKIDEFNLRGVLLSKIDVFVEKLHSFWENMFKELRKEILDQFTVQLGKKVSSAFSNDVLLNIFERTLIDLNQYSVLPLSRDYKIYDGSGNCIETISGVVQSKMDLEVLIVEASKKEQKSKEFPGVSKKEVQELLDSTLTSIRNELKYEIMEFFKNMIKNFFNIADNQVKLIIGEIDELNTNIISHINEEKEKYINKLQKELENREESVRMYENASKTLGELKEILMIK